MAGLEPAPGTPAWHREVLHVSLCPHYTDGTTTGPPVQNRRQARLITGCRNLPCPEGTTGRADGEIRTRNLHVGNVMPYQFGYARMFTHPDRAGCWSG